MTRASVFRRQPAKAQNNSEEESIVMEAVAGLKSGKYKTPAKAANALNVPEKRITIWRRWKGIANSRVVSHHHQQLLCKEQEQSLIEFIQFLGRAGFPLSKRTIAPKVFDLCNRKPSRGWVYRFLNRHPDCTLGRPTGLDPKRARAFNYPSVNTHFTQLQDILKKHGIPWKNVHNMDEIGIQLGGGRKRNGEVYFFPSADKSRYIQRSDNLELITVIESICGDGSAPVKPCFIFSGVKMCEEWFNNEDGIL
jgi:hypothetical protein